MNYNPLDYRRPYVRLEQAGQQFAGAIGSAVAEIPEVVELRKNAAKNEDIYNEDVLPQVQQLSDFDIQLTGFDSKDVLGSALKPDKRETNIQYVARVAKILSPIAQHKASQSIEMQKEQKTQARQGEISAGVTAGMRPDTRQVEISAPNRYIQHRSGLGLQTPESGTAKIYEAAPGTTPRTQEEIVGKTMESWPTGRPVPTMSELKEEPRVATAPTQRDILAEQREARLGEKMKLDEAWRATRSAQSDKDDALAWARLQNAIAGTSISAATKTAFLQERMNEVTDNLSRIQQGQPIIEYQYDEFGMRVGVPREANAFDQARLEADKQRLSQLITMTHGVASRPYGQYPAPRISAPSAQLPVPLPQAPSQAPSPAPAQSGQSWEQGGYKIRVK